MAQVVKNTRDAMWLARWRDPAGAQRKKSFKRKVDAERFLSELQTQMNRGTYIDPAAGKRAAVTVHSGDHGEQQRVDRQVIKPGRAVQPLEQIVRRRLGP